MSEHTLAWIFVIKHYEGRFISEQDSEFKKIDCGCKPEEQSKILRQALLEFRAYYIPKFLHNKREKGVIGIELVLKLNGYDDDRYDGQFCLDYCQL